MKIFAFGSSIVSSYWNGAATYYRGCYKYLARLGYDITFAEPDAYGRQQHRDSDDFSYVKSQVYQPPAWMEAETSIACSRLPRRPISSSSTPALAAMMPCWSSASLPSAPDLR